jgi:hypothetical protein
MTYDAAVVGGGLAGLVQLGGEAHNPEVAARPFAKREASKWLSSK